jgi:hypothetical protein
LGSTLWILPLITDGVPRGDLDADAAALRAEDGFGDGAASVGLGRIVALYYRPSTLYQIH